MPWRIPIAALCGVFALIAALHAQTPPDTQPSVDARLDRIERRFEEMERRHQAELQQRDQEIARLKALLEQRPAPKPPADQPSQDILGQIDAAGPKTAAPTTGRVDSSTDAALRDIGSSAPLAKTARTAISFNPDLAVVGDFHANWSSDHDNPARNRFDIASVELDLRAAVDPRADAVVILPVSRDTEDPLFFGGGSSSSAKVYTSIDIEEAYLFLHDFGVSNLTAKLGRFHLRFGRQNILHSHDWPTVDNNFVNQSFLNSESLSDSGVSLSYVIPPKLVGNQYIEVIGEIITGEGNDGPVLSNNHLVAWPAFNLHALWNRDIAKDWNLEVGTSFLHGHRNDDPHQNASLFGVDLTLLYTDPTGQFNNRLFQFEAIYGMVDTSHNDTQYAWGAYLLGQQQLNRDWYTGLRLDWTQNALDDQQEVWGVSPYVSWYLSEFLRLRLEYQHKAGDVKTENTIYFQATFIFGAHPPHPYWAMH